MAVEVYGAGGTEKTKQTKTVTPSTSLQTVTPDSEDYELEKVNVQAMPAGLMSDITVSTSGLITSKIGTSGYLAQNTQKTKQLSTVAAQSYMPGTEDREIIASGKYTTGSQKVKGDVNLLPANIAKGKYIFGIEGLFSGDGKNLWKKYSTRYGALFQNETLTRCNGDARYSRLVEFNNELYLIGNYTSQQQMHKWSGSSWDTLITMPGSYIGGIACVYNGELHIGFQYGLLYKWDGADWTQLTTAPNTAVGACNYATVVYNGKIHVIGSTNTGNNYIHYAWDGANWTQLTGLPSTAGTGGGCGAVFGNKIYVFAQKNVLSWSEDTGWQTVINGTFPEIVTFAGCCVFDNKIVIAVNSSVYTFDGENITKVGDLPATSTQIYSCVFNECIYINTYNTSAFIKIAHLAYITDEFLTYVIDESEDAFPDDGVQGGNYYKKLVITEGNEFSSGTITLSSTQYYVEIPHNLGVLPDYIMIQRTGQANSTTSRAFYLNYGTYYGPLVHAIRGTAVSQKSKGTERYSTTTWYQDTEVFTIPAYSTSYGFSGTYMWIAGCFE